MSTRLRLLCALACILPAAAQAVCFHPGSDRSGYVVPLRQEAATADWIVVARIVARSTGPDENPRHGPDAPAGQRIRVELVRTLKGRAPQTFELQSPDDSGGYRVAVGETHLLFLKAAPRPQLDACGNSGALPQAEATLRATEQWLGEPRPRSR